MSIPQAPAVNTAPVVAPAAPQSNDEAIGNFARGFLNELDRDDNPDQGMEEVEATPETEPPVEPQEPEAETPPPEPEIPMVEVDVDGEKFTIPEKVKHRVMADKDYRQKTMEVAATKKQLETLTANAAQLAQQAQQMAPYYAQLQQMDTRANQLQRALQSPELAADPLEYNRAQSELAILLHTRTQFAQGLQQQTSQFQAQQTHLRAQQLALDTPQLFEKFPELKTPETQQKLAKYVRDEGLPQEAIDFLNYSAAGVKLAYKAHQYDLMVSEQAASRAKLKETVKALPSAPQSSRAADSGAKEKQLRAEWKKNGGNINDPAFSQLLRGKLRG